MTTRSANSIRNRQVQEYINEQSLEPEMQKYFEILARVVEREVRVDNEIDSNFSSLNTESS